MTKYTMASLNYKCWYKALLLRAILIKYPKYFLNGLNLYWLFGCLITAVSLWCVICTWCIKSLDLLVLFYGKVSCIQYNCSLVQIITKENSGFTNGIFHGLYLLIYFADDIWYIRKWFLFSAFTMLRLQLDEKQQVTRANISLLIFLVCLVL